MGNRRMISKTVTQTQRFLQMPLGTQALYFHLIQNSDDDGIVEAFPIVRMIGSNEDDLKLLIAKNFVKPLNEEMVFFITDFHEQNLVQSHHYKKSRYQDLLAIEDKLINPRIKSIEITTNEGVEESSQVVNKMLSESSPNISQSSQNKDSQIKNNSNKENVIEDRSVESKTTSKEEIYIDNFDATTDFSKIRNIEDYLGDNYLTDLSDEKLITGFTQYYLARVPDNYELNTLKKRLKTIDREILQQAYKQASMNGADTLAYIVATLKNWEKLNITSLDDWNNHELQRERTKQDDDLPF